MTIYQELQDEFRKWDEAIDEQSEQLVFAANLMASRLPKFLGVADPAAVRIGVGCGDAFEARNLDIEDCEPDGIGQLNFTLRLRILPTGDPSYEWNYDVQMRISIDADNFVFSTISLLGNSKSSESFGRDAVQNGAFAPIYEAIVKTVKDDFDSKKVKRIS
ncbi:hypothetical protein [Pseudomonas sp. 2hn]|uniref:hypothetical protein n=1 Tax=Pseudomonas sp. 2hn TaxID=2866626 RepID=UPI001C7D5027|nr:hypothetical protein [Pseudomonas sp. 2hn]QZA52626.1 hypothetical protein K2O50_16545 [Pseudomonas sp. 2hn]